MRIVAISDQHGELPDIPPCDLLLVAGDNCLDYPKGHRDRIGSGPQTSRQLSWFYTEWMPWRMRQPAKLCYLTWGNHDYCGELLHANGSYNDLSREIPRSSDGYTTIAVKDGECIYDGLRIWLTPWSSQFKDWAFMADEERLVERYAAIPEGIDILVSHQPPKGYGDMMVYDLNTGWESLGSVALLDAVQRVKPRVLICGHIHSGYGHVTMPLGDGKVCEVYNVALLNERYEMVHEPTVIDL